ncbi:hypothetical protein NE236_28805 [Actinoallomurus purpureus]|uniref:hypothetical protein n=1 Tax=Actinoallomurus purpureus TaxID=478114 RepID=UPI00209272D7|nr:hypothetical protein [Actinoallomurus purpureus]MCO6008981.1 hypothetical protein [Actinoallomurus purpureus]
MATKKLSITLPADLAEMVKRQAQEEETSVSAVIADAVAVLARRRAAHEATRAFESEEGPFLPVELAEAEALWQRIESHDGREHERRAG